MKTYATLLQREWMQHRLGWTITVVAPLAIALVVLAVGQVTIDLDDADATVHLSGTQLALDRVPPVVLAFGTIAASAALTLLIAWFTALVQAPGLARRDRQDRSIEFWLSLPTGHAGSLAVPLVAHLVLFPIAALGVGLVSGFIVSPLFVAKAAGLGEWFALPWGTMLPAAFALAAQVALGVVIATVWISPLVLVVMAASAWLKRWGLPVVAVGLVVIGNLLDRLYGNAIVWRTLRQLLNNAGEALVGPPRSVRVRGVEDVTDMLAAIPGWSAEHALQAVRALADPLLALALAVSAVSFWLLVLRRKRGA